MKHKMTKLLIAISVFTLTQPLWAENHTGFDRIQSLVGDWQGTLPDGNPIDITYREISGGAIVEVYHSTDPMWWNMSSVYHADTDKVIMSHYCSWGNHPRMTATPQPANDKELAFMFLDITSTQPENGYMHNATFQFDDQDHFSHHWTWREDGKDTLLTLRMERKK